MKSNSSDTEKATSSNKLTRYMKAPFRALVRVRDMYVNGLSGCAGRIERGRIIPSTAAMPRSRSHGFYQSRTSSVAGGDDVNELVRAESQRRLDTMKEARAVPVRCQSSAGVGNIGRIDEEDEACEFEGYNGHNKDVMFFPRSRSCAVGGAGERRRVMVGAIAAA